MATYNDIVRLRGGKPAYSITEEGADDWQSFIPHEQFNAVLRTVLRSVHNNDIDVHKSFWIDGTYGTGKSHAAAVVSHLLCDAVDDIRQWVDYEYKAQRYEQLRSSIYALRSRKRLLCVKVYGLGSMERQGDLGALLQRCVHEAARREGIDLSGMPTDFQVLSAHVEKNPELWDLMIEKQAGLSTVVSGRAHLRELLAKGDMGIYHAVGDALAAHEINVKLGNASVTQWLTDVQALLRERTPFSGLLVVWDEFTDVMKDAVGLAVLKQLQEVAERFMNPDSDSYLFLISHPSALDKVGQDVRRQTDGRYHREKYNMESVSAFKIMSRKLEVVDAERHAAKAEEFFALVPGMLDMFTRTSNDTGQTRDDLRALFPLHPGTANLATHYATVVGSSSRSVFEFLGQNEAITEFLASEEHYLNGDVLTADYLWDYVLDELHGDPLRFGAVTERFAAHREHARNAGPAHEAVFKGVLLLNAFCNVSQESNQGLVVPSAENVRLLFEGSQYAEMVDQALDWLHGEGIIQRAPDGLYSVQFSAFAASEVAKKNEELRATEFRFTHKVVDFAGETVRYIVEKKLFPKVIRPYAYRCYSEVGNEAVLRGQLQNGRRDTPASHYFFALMVGRTAQEVINLQALAQKFAAESDVNDLGNVVYFVMDEPMGEQAFGQFIEYQTNLALASAHGFVEQVKSHRSHATDMVKQWWEAIGRGNCNVYCGAEKIPTSAKHLSIMVNGGLTPKVFPFGAEAHEVIRQKSPTTFWKPLSSKEVVRTVLFATSRQDILEKCSAQMKPLHFLFDDSVDENLDWKESVPDGHPLKALCDKVVGIVNHTTKSNTFNLDERMRELTKPPFGLYGSFANMGMLAFALRPWIGKIFDQQGKPRDANAMVDDIQQLFKVWDEGKSNSKLNFKFQTKEEGALCKELVRLFKLSDDVTSLTDARFHITGSFLEARKAPLWVLKHTPSSVFGGPDDYVMPEGVMHLIDDIVKLCEEQSDMRNPALLSDTLTLIKRYRMDLGNIVGKQQAFDEGMKAYLIAQHPSHVNEGNIDEARTYISRHMQSSIGHWTEEQVSNALKDWIISKKPIEQQPMAPQYMPESRSEQSYAVAEPSEGQRERARAKVNNILLLHDAKKILLRLCESGNSWVLREIMK